VPSWRAPWSLACGISGLGRDVQEVEGVVMSIRRRPVGVSARAQRGQAIIWLIGVMGATAAVVYGVYNVTQITVGKEKTVNAADTAALAGSKVEARMLNLMAYNNRSMISNEVALVQFASLDDWLGYIAKTSKNFGSVLRWIPYLNYLGALLQQAGTYLEYARNYGTTYAIDGMSAIMEGEKAALKIAHGLMSKVGWEVAKEAAMATVAANRTNFNGHDDAGLVTIPRADQLLFNPLPPGKNVYAWANFTHLYSGTDRDDVATVIQDSRDQWSTNRPGSTVLQAAHFNVGVAAGGLTKLGPTILKDYDHWQTEDTLEAWTKIPFLSRKYLPIGWGRTNVTTDGNDEGKMAPGRTAQSDAQNAEKTHRIWTGMPSIYDLTRYSRFQDEQNAYVDFIMVVARNQSANLTTSQLNMGTDAGVSPIGASNMDERLASDRVAAIGYAQAIFERPASTSGDRTGSSLFRSDTSKEYGSLYSPYWEARLAPVTSGLKLSVYTALGLNTTLSFYTP
jgi:hypothetical protein